MEFNSKKIGQKINGLLADNNKSQKDLAEYLKIDQSTISHFVNGRRTPNIRQIVQIASFLNTTTDYLLGLATVPTSDKDLKFVCEYMGLPEDLVKYIKNIPNKETVLFFTSGKEQMKNE